MCKRQGLLLLALFVFSVDAAAAVEVVPDWNAISSNAYPLAPATPLQPVLSADGIVWTYDRIVLTEPFHLAYPYVFKCDGQYLMALAPCDSLRVALYRAHDFPYDWRYEMTLVAGRAFVDPTVIRYDETWWLFSGRSGSGHCDLFFSDDLASGWVEHPMSPITTDPGKGRPAGRFIVYDSGRILRLGQKNNVHYGEAVRAFEIDVLTRTEYAEHEIPESPILAASGYGWNRDGMHTCDAWWNGDHWLAAVDGIEEWFSIGIYRSVDFGPTLDVKEPGPADVDLRLLSCSPNPFTDSIGFLYRAIGPSPSAQARVRIYAIDGRLVWEGTGNETGPGLRAIRWTGTDLRGSPAANGTYLYDLRIAGRPVRGSFVRLR